MEPSGKGENLDAEIDPEIGAGRLGRPGWHGPELQSMVRVFAAPIAPQGAYRNYI